MNNQRERLRLWVVGGLPAVRIRAGEELQGMRPRWEMLHVSISESRIVIRPEVVAAFRAVPEMRRQERLRILGDEALCRAWRMPGLAFGDIIIPEVTCWVHPLPTLPEDISGVLGLDVLERLSAIVNLRAGWLTVSAEEPTTA